MWCSTGEMAQYADVYENYVIYLGEGGCLKTDRVLYHIPLSLLCQSGGRGSFDMVDLSILSISFDMCFHLSRFFDVQFLLTE